MELALTFGAVGDFLSIALLIKDIISALDECRGSAKSYHDLTQGITLLGEAIKQAEQIYQGSQLPDGLEDLAPIAKATIAQIRTSLKSFRDQVCKKYDHSLAKGGSGNIFKDVSRKIQWKLEEKDAVKFRAEVAGYTMSLKMLLEVTTL